MAPRTLPLSRTPVEFLVALVGLWIAIDYALLGSEAGETNEKSEPTR